MKPERNFSTCEYLGHVRDLIAHRAVVSMTHYSQHGHTTCLEHSLRVSYTSYKICKRLGLDARSAARGGLLHDFFLYDWHEKNSHRGLHGFTHPKAALKNAEHYFDLNERERDIIASHMWPLTPRLPKYREAYVVLMADKYCALLEIFISPRRAKADSEAAA
jgi:uncharacterized protein